MAVACPCLGRSKAAWAASVPGRSLGTLVPSCMVRPVTRSLTAPRTPSASARHRYRVAAARLGPGRTRTTASSADLARSSQRAWTPTTAPAGRTAPHRRRRHRTTSWASGSGWATPGGSSASSWPRASSAPARRATSTGSCASWRSPWPEGNRRAWATSAAPGGACSPPARPTPRCAAARRAHSCWCSRRGRRRAWPRSGRRPRRRRSPPPACASAATTTAAREAPCLPA
mmetsp:Transcript_4146/g.12927  ORF Transcript_4146/g.12927 Transcript_4146/m.12927 type:complete len:230 (-) Transcript_4146:1164-1853(-)